MDANQHKLQQKIKKYQIQLEKYKDNDIKLKTMELELREKELINEDELSPRILLKEYKTLYYSLTRIHIETQQLVHDLTDVIQELSAFENAQKQAIINLIKKHTGYTLENLVALEESKPEQKSEDPELEDSG